MIMLSQTSDAVVCVHENIEKLQGLESTGATRSYF